MKKRLLGIVGVVVALAVSLALLPVTAQAATPITLTQDDINNGTYADVPPYGPMTDLKTGDYRLGEDITIRQTLCLGSGFDVTITLDLNGHVLTMTGNNAAIELGSTSKLTIRDSNPNSTHGDGLPNGGVITGNGRGIDCAGSLVLEGGTIYKCKANGGGVYVFSESSFTMKGGAIIGCGSNSLGGGVYCDGTFIMSGGSITGCTAGSGSGIYLLYGTMHANGGTVSDDVDIEGSAKIDRTATGGLSTYTEFTGNVTLSGGSIDESATPYTVKFNCYPGTFESGTSATAQHILKGQKAKKPEDPTRTGYVLRCWIPKGTTAAFDFDTTITKNIELTASWALVDYAITYDLAGGTNDSSNPATYTVISDAITLAAPTREGYTFTGWSGTDLTGDNNLSVTIAKGSTGGRSYTAHWTPITYTITYDLDGGTNAASNPASYTVESADITLAEPTRGGYVFSGWSGTDLTGDDNLSVEISKGSTGDRNYTAHWRRDVSGASVTVSSLIYTGKDQTPEVTVTIDGKTLAQGTDYSVDVTAQSNAGSYSLTVNGIGGYAGSQTVDWSIAKAGQSITASDITAAYGDTDKTVSATGTFGAVSYAVTSGDDVVSVDPVTGHLSFHKAGEAIVTVTAAGDANHEPGSKDVKVTVGKAKAVVTKAPTAEELTYNGSAQELISAGTATGGTLAYSLDSGDSKNWSANIPTAIDAGSYTVYYKVQGDDNHTDSDVASVSVTIAKATPSVSAWPSIPNVYVGDPITTSGLTGTASTSGTFAVTSAVTSWDTAGTHQVTVAFTPADAKNYQTVTSSTNLSVVKRTVESVTTSIGPVTGLFYGTPLDELGLPDKVDIKTVDGKEFKGVPVTWDASSYNSSSLTQQTVTGTLDLSAIDNEVEQPSAPVVASASVTLKQRTAVAPSYPDKSAVYTGQPIKHELVAPEGVVSVAYSYEGIDGTSYGPTAEAPTNAGTYKVIASFTMEACHAQLGPVTAKLTIDKANPTITTWPTIGDIRIGDTLTDASLMGGTATPEGAFSITSESKSWDAAGEESVEVTFTPTDSANYNTEKRNVSVNVLKLTADTPALAAKTAPYTGQAIPNEFDTLPTGVASVTYEYTGTDGTTYGPTTTAPIDAGTYTVTATFTMDSKYEQLDSVNSSLTITKADQNLTGEDVSLAYGDADRYVVVGSAVGVVSYSVTSGTDVIEVGSDGLITTLKAGEAQVTVTAAGDANHNAASMTVKVTVAKATPSVTAWPTIANVYVNQEVTDANLRGGEATVPGSFSITSETRSWSETGSKTVEVTFTPEDTDNYEAVKGEVTVNVVRRHRSGGGGSSSSTITVPVFSDHGAVNVTARISGTTATLDVSDAQVEKVIADHAGTVVVDVSGLSGVDTVTLRAHVVAKTHEAEDTGLSLVLPTGSLTFDETALGSVNTGQDLTVSLKSVAVANLTSQEAQALSGKANAKAAVDVEVQVGAKRHTDFAGGTLTVSLPYASKAGEDTDLLEVWHVRDDGSIEKLGGTYDAKAQRFIFKTGHLSRFILVRVDGSENPFTDVRDGDWFKDAALWAYRNSVMRGYGGTTLFGSGDPLTTEQLAAVLWNIAEPGHSTGNVADTTGFADVRSNEWYTGAMNWAKEHHIINGYGDTGYAGIGEPLTTERFVAIVANWLVGDAHTSANASRVTSLFVDGEDISEWARTAAVWATDSGLLRGYPQGDGTYRLAPQASIPRERAAAILYNAYRNGLLRLG